MKSALDSGLSEICFLDHLTLHPGSGGLSMTPEEVPLYYYAVRRLGARYRGRISVKAGLEVDFTPGLMDVAKSVCSSFAFDVIAGSIHFLGSWNMVSRRERAANPYKDNDAMYESYIDAIEAMLEDPFYDVICHLDVVSKFGDEPSRDFRGRWRGVLEKISANNIVVEINTSGFRYPLAGMFPGEDLLAMLAQSGAAITLGSDAHRPDQVGMRFADAVDAAKKAGFTSLAAFTKRRRTDIELKL